MARALVPFIRATAANACGPACLEMMLSYHGISVRPGQTLQRVELQDDGTSALDLVLAARELGLSLVGVTLEADDLDLLPLPAIVHFQRHFVILEGRVGRDVSLVDPEAGRLSVSRELFATWFSGTALHVSPDNG